MFLVVCSSCSINSLLKYMFYGSLLACNLGAGNFFILTINNLELQNGAVECVTVLYDCVLIGRAIGDESPF